MAQEEAVVTEVEFKLAKYEDGSGHFARVTVRAVRAKTGVEVVEAISPIYWEEGEVDRASEPEWVEAAVQGALDCGRSLVGSGRLIRCRAEIVRVVGLSTDTTPADVRCAAFLATWAALVSGSPPPFVFEEGDWRTDLP